MGTNIDRDEPRVPGTNSAWRKGNSPISPVYTVAVTTNLHAKPDDPICQPTVVFVSQAEVWYSCLLKDWPPFGLREITN